MDIKPARFNVAITRDALPRRLEAEMASRKKGVSAGRQIFTVEGATYTLKEMVLRTGKEGREVQKRYSTVIRKRVAPWEDFIEGGR